MCPNDCVWRNGHFPRGAFMADGYFSIIDGGSIPLPPNETN